MSFFNGRIAYLLGDSKLNDHDDVHTVIVYIS